MESYIVRLLSGIKRRLGRWLRPPAPVVGLLHRHAFRPGTLVFQCNVCSAKCALPLGALEREAGHCGGCDSNMRFRSLVHHLSSGLFGESLAIRDFPFAAQRLSGIGMSDAPRLAAPLGRRLKYRNTFYHQEPRLDIHAPGAEHLGAYDFVISSDVFEHVDPPVEKAFANMRRLLKPGGLLVFTVPFAVQGDTVEHFPGLHQYTIENRGGTYVLVNTTADGRREEHANLVFHGGPGSTLELRLFSESGLRRNLEGAGFGRIAFHREPCFKWGIYWKAPWSVPITAIAA